MVPKWQKSGDVTLEILQKDVLSDRVLGASQESSGGAKNTMIYLEDVIDYSVGLKRKAQIDMLYTQTLLAVKEPQARKNFPVPTRRERLRMWKGFIALH